MKKLLISLGAVSLISTSLAQATISTIKNSKIENPTFLSNRKMEKEATDTFKLSLLTENFEVDDNNEIVPNRAYDKTAEMQSLLKEWQDYKKTNSIHKFNYDKIETKFDALNSSGNDVDKMFYKNLLRSNNVEVLNLQFHIYDKEQSQYTIGIVGDFIIDGKEYSNVSLSGYNERQYFTSWQILSNFSITVFFELFDTYEVVHGEKWSVDIEDYDGTWENNTDSLFSDLANEFQDHFVNNEEDFNRIDTVYFIIKDFDNNREYYLDAEDIREKEYFGIPYRDTYIALMIQKNEDGTAYLAFNSFIFPEDSRIRAITGLWSDGEYPQLFFKSSDMEVSLFTEMVKK
ncbi:hypothetical protein [Mesoplasma seiffertii]|uniref:hypothetical protein n=1 Tax=Mesoplasma seiffertii TaxID=28224 RepID=UPI00047E5BD5|nr:hypothetical protein [Mesoplasma seiffertii]